MSEFEHDKAKLMFRGIAKGSMLSTHPTLSERKHALEIESTLGKFTYRQFIRRWRQRGKHTYQVLKMLPILCLYIR